MDTVGLPARMADRLARGRAAAESRMLDTFAIKLPTGWEMVDGVEVRTFDPLFTTPGRVKVSSSGMAGAVNDKEGGSRVVVEVTRTLHIPVHSPAVPVGAVAECIAVDDSSDPTLLGALLVIAGPAPGSQTTARRLEVSEVIT